MCNKENATVAELCNTASRKSQKSTILYVLNIIIHKAFLIISPPFANFEFLAKKGKVEQLLVP